ncbi:MAG: ABC transporter ATP-binding protein [Armatimonadetes bacterium]|nr:ABC transporter ATP-binding protein [Armatimonadota bacterium]
MDVIRRIGVYLRPYWPHLAGGLICALVAAAAGLFVPRYLGSTIDALIRTRDMGLLNLTALVVLGAFIVRSAFLYGQLYLMFFLGHRVVADMRADIFAQVQRWSLDRFVRWHSGEVISRAIQDTQMVQTHLLGGLVEFVGVAITLAGIVVMVFWIQWQLALLTLLVIPLFFGTARLFGMEVQRISATAQQKMADLTTLLRDAVVGARIVRAFVQEGRELGRFRTENDRNFRENLRISKLIATEFPVVSLLTTLGLVLVLWRGGLFVTRSAMSAGDLVAFLAYVALAVEPAQQITRLYSGMRQAAASLDRIAEILETPGTVPEAPDAVEMPEIRGHVRFDAVSFTYATATHASGVPGVPEAAAQMALREVTFDVRPGERVALVGPSGAGKSTLVNLIPRFYDPTEGRVLVDGYDIREVRIASLRRQIGLVPQETVLFQGTIRENIAYGRPDATDEEIVAASRAANAHEFIERLSQGYETVLSEGGIQLSGGQRQRLAIARAILNQPRLILLDEATSALDSESEALVAEALDRLTEGRTTVIVAHRLASVRRADRIIVLLDGRIVEEGRHAELIGQEGVYHRLSRLQWLE